MILGLIRKNIREWYKEILSFAKDEMGAHLASQGQPKTRQKISNMVSTLLESDRRDAARESVSYLKDTVNNPNISGIKNLNIASINEIIYLINGRSTNLQGGILSEGFIHLARDDNDAANLREVITSWTGKESFVQLLAWLHDLEVIKDQIDE